MENSRSRCTADALQTSNILEEVHFNYCGEVVSKGASIQNINQRDLVALFPTSSQKIESRFKMLKLHPRLLSLIVIKSSLKYDSPIPASQDFKHGTLNFRVHQDISKLSLKHGVDGVTRQAASQRP